jgi:beta-phosphoglucomutase-like phosphatase (HAD superfamily)
MSLQAVIFDLDGTLVDTELLWADALRAYLADHGCACDKTQILDIVFGRSWTDIYRSVVALQPALAAVPVANMAVALRAYYIRLRDQSDDIVIASSSRLLKQLATEFPVIIVSGSPRADVEEAVRLLEAEPHVRFVLGARTTPRASRHLPVFWKARAVWASTRKTASCSKIRKPA